VNRIIFATKNRGKLREVKNIFEGSRFEIVSLLDFKEVPEIIEDKETFEENALLKAKTVYEYYGISAMGDDSGLAVEQLNWGPGVYSARYAGENATDDENNIKLLNDLKEFPEPHTAKFVCAGTYYSENRIFTAQGVVNGRIVKVPQGSNGFGYDPLFIPEGYDITMGEFDLEEKNKISHRSQAFRKLRFFLEHNME
jgi:non-canonical purine NTP pyrophosphatase (RdgB/HAM1 family)